MRAGRRTAAGTWRSALLLFTACRRSDVVELGRQHILDGWIIFEQTKTGGRVEVPILPPLTKVLPADRVTFLVTERGASFSVEGFGNWFRAHAMPPGSPRAPMD